ncbi:MAG: hypothetical protein HQL41_13560, partial [Alphaproteobacteria bacterium]|nr:hypothetical protein [Alphaproteobacteria bacterium]
MADLAIDDRRRPRRVQGDRKAQLILCFLLGFLLETAYYKLIVNVGAVCPLGFRKIMALSSNKVSAASAVGTSSAPARPAATARAFSATSVPQIDNIHYGVPAGPDRDWVRSEEWGTGGGSGARQRGKA